MADLSEGLFSARWARPWPAGAVHAAGGPAPRERSPRSAKSERTVAALAALCLSGAAVAGMGIAYSELRLPDVTLLVISAALLVCAVGSLVSCVSRDRAISPQGILSVVFITHFAVPGVLLAAGVLEFVNSANSRYVEAAQLFVLLSFVGTQAACVLTERHYHGRAPRRRIVPSWSPIRAAWGLMLLVLLGWAARAVVIASGFYLQFERTAHEGMGDVLFTPLMAFEELPLYALILSSLVIWTPAFSPKVLRRFWRALIVLYAAELVYWLPTGRRTPLVLALIMPFVCRHWLTGWKPRIRSVVAYGLLLLALLAGIDVYRTAAAGFLTKREAWTFAEAVRSGREVGQTVPELMMPVFDRLNLVEPVSASLRLRGSPQWKFWPGEIHVEGLLVLIPRVLWPGKPKYHYGTDFGHASGLSWFMDERTSISVTFLGESYLDCGWLGPLVLALMYVPFAVLYERAVSLRTMSARFLYVASLPTLLYVGGAFALSFGALAKLLVFLWLLSWWMNRRRGSGRSTEFACAA